MGSSSSRLAPRPTTRRHGISSFLCGSASSFEAEAEAEPSAASSSASPSVDYNASVKPMFRARLDESIATDNVHTSTKDPSLNFPTEKGTSSSITEDISFIDSMQTDGSPEASTRLRNADLPSNVNVYQARSVRTSRLPRTSAEPNLLEMRNTSNSLVAPLEVGNLVAEHGSIAASMRLSSGIAQFEQLENVDEIAVTGTPSGTMPIEQRDAGELPGLPSGSEGASIFETRRNSRRLFWDALSRRISRINVSSSEEILSSESTSTQDSWLFDFDGHMLRDNLEDSSMSSRHMRRRRLGLSGLTRFSRSEGIRERIQSGVHDNHGETTYCQSGLHPEGTCSCNAAVVAEVSNTRASFARIVMLAEALFEVLDEIHRQPGTLGLSSGSIPAKDFIVNSLPTRVYKKLDIEERGDANDQCHICLAEYEDGESIRILPCCHEYHMSCVDKWLKEVHGVCPLCRGNVGKGSTEGWDSIL